MEPGLALLVILALFLLLGVPALAIAAFVRVRGLKDWYGKAPQILGRLYAVEQRLTQIENGLATLASASRAPKTPEAIPSAPPAAQAKPISPASLKPEPLRTIPGEAAPSVPAATPTRPAISPAVLTQPRSSEPITDDGGRFEVLIAGRWMNYIGILALLLAVAFFLKYAFENNWVGPRGRVGMGLLIGSALFPWSNRLLSRGYKHFSEGIAGLGAAVLYVSLWAGWHYYQLFPQSAAFGLMILVTATATIVAVGRNSQVIAVLALLGGVVTPLLVSTAKNQEVVLFTYIAILGAGMLGVARARDWKTLAPIQFASTLIYFWGWYGTFYRDAELLPTAFFATLFFLLFAALPVVRSWRQGELSILETIIVLTNALAYLVALRALLWPEHRWALTLAVVALAAMHIAVERALPQKRPPDLRMARVVFAGLALTFVTLAIPIRLDGKWITMAWAVEGAVLIGSGLRIRIAALRGAGFILFLVAAARLTFIPIPAPQFLLNARFAAFAISVACFLLACYFARTAGVEFGETERFAFAATAIAASSGALVALSLETWDLFDRMPSLGIDRSLAQQLALSTLWLVYALALIIAGVRRKSARLRWQALALLGIVIVKVFVFDLSFLDRFYRIVSFFLLGLVLMLISFFYQRRLAAQENKKEP
jgi:uncharacterized membrane protein